ncbi:lasso peptide biosynthesis B2 protein [Streptomyces sp. JNUCC 64]
MAGSPDWCDSLAWAVSYLQPRCVRLAYAVRAVRWAAWVMPMRWACLEDSVAAALLLAVTRRRAEWRHGVATDPVRLHAWITGPDGEPVEESADIAFYTATYTPDGPATQGPE